MRLYTISKQQRRTISIILTCVIALAGYLAADSSHVSPQVRTTATKPKASPTGLAANILTSLKQDRSYPVSKTVDGDTITVLIDDAAVTVRLIGVNTPETVDPRKTVECFGKEASGYTAKLLRNASVRLQIDPKQSSLDKYGRLLAYVTLVKDDGTEVDVNKQLISEGYAYEYTYDKPYERQIEYKKAQTDAQVWNRGLWNSTTCNGKKQ